MTHGPYQKRSATEKRRLLKRWRESGLGPYVFGQQVGVAHSTLYRWVEQERRLKSLARQLIGASTVEDMVSVLAEHDIQPRGYLECT